MYVKDKVVLITGGLGGVGFPTVQSLIRSGAKFVALLDLFEPNHEAVVDANKKLEQEFDEETFRYYTCDIRNHKQFIAIYDEVAKLKNYIDVVINNAAVLNENNIDLQIDTNFIANMEISLLAIEKMGKHKFQKGGVILNFSSTFAVQYSSLAPVYCATKCGIMAFVQAMEENCKSLGIRLLCLCPGMTRTNMFNMDRLCEITSPFATPESLAEIEKGYIQKPENVASAVIEMLNKGKNGGIWIVQNDEPPFAIKNKSFQETFA